MRRFLCAALVCLLLFPTVSAYAAIPYMSTGYVPYYSFGYWRLDVEGKKFGHFLVQTPYKPAAPYTVLGNPLYKDGQSVPGFESPADLYIDEEDYIYVVDYRQSRAVKMTEQGEILAEYGDKEGPGALREPEGIYVAKDGDVYICDTVNQRVAIFDNSGAYKSQLVKPDDIRIQDVLFLPERISIDSRGFYVLLLKGVNQGLLLLTPNGEFNSFFGANKTQLTMLDKVKSRLYSYSQRLATQVVANTVSDMYIDGEGYIYTATSNATEMQIKKFNVGSENLYKDRQMDVYPMEARDEGFTGGMVTAYKSVCADAQGNVYALDAGTGRIFQFDKFGEPVFSFGEKMYDKNAVTVGMLGDPVSMRINSKGMLFVADRVYKGIVVYKPTTYAKKINQVNYLYNDGRYGQAVPYAREILRDNVYFDKANIVIGKAHYQSREWESAMQYFRKAFNTKEYSDAFWEWRLVLVQRYFAYAVAALMAVAVGISLKNVITKKNRKAASGNKN